VTLPVRREDQYGQTGIGIIATRGDFLSAVSAPALGVMEDRHVQAACTNQLHRASSCPPLSAPRSSGARAKEVVSSSTFDIPGADFREAQPGKGHASGDKSDLLPMSGRGL
jgi:hypothetical protein